MSAFWRDTVYGFRQLAKRPVVTLAAVLSLALGIGSNTAMFSVINAVLWRPLPYTDPHRLVMIRALAQRSGAVENVSGPEYTAWRDQSRALEHVGAVYFSSRDLGAVENGAAAERVIGVKITPEIFDALGVRPVVGRLFTAAEDQLGSAAPVAVISYRLWQRRFGGDPSVINGTLRMDSAPTSVIGVMPPGFDFPNKEVEYWIPSNFTSAMLQSSTRFIEVVARLRPGFDIGQARAEALNIHAQLIDRFPDRYKGWTIGLEPLQDALFGQYGASLWMLQGAVACVLLIACANVAGLLLARGAARQGEIALRTALGASRATVVRQFLTESVWLALCGGALGVGLAWAALRLIVGTAPRWLPRPEQMTIDTRVGAFTVMLSIVSGLAFGVIPALHVSMSNLRDFLVEYGRGGAVGIARHRLRATIMATQIALSFVLLASAGLMINSFLRLQRSDVGANPANVLTFRVNFPFSQAAKPAGSYGGEAVVDINLKPALSFDRLLELLRGVPGVRSAAGVSRPPLTEPTRRIPFAIEGALNDTAGDRPLEMSAAYYALTPDFFSTMRIPLKGRDFSPHDVIESRWVAIVNETMARRYWPNENAIGKRLTLRIVPEEQPREVIGIAGDTRSDRWSVRATPIIYVMHRQQPARYLNSYWGDRAQMTFVLRTSGPPMSLEPAVRRAVAALDPDRPAAAMRPLEDYLDSQVDELRYYILLLGAFGVMAAALVAVGVYGLMAHAVAERTRDIGVRMALGASASRVFVLIAREALAIIAIGLVLGLAASAVFTRLIAAQLWGVRPTDPLTLAAASVLVIAVGLLACSIPLRRAVRIPPVIALRAD